LSLPVKVRALCCIAALALALGAARANAEGDPRELKAREDFAAGRYQQALDVFAKLYAETLHPTYLRNIGRCYQNLGEPDKAITSFREYLRKHKSITPEERSDVEGYIAEMEQLKKSRSPSPPPTSAATSLTTAPEPKDSGGAAPEALVTAPAKPADEESSPVYTRWWFWTLVGAAAAGVGIGIFAATGGFTKTQDAPCKTGYNCP
jgi:tetratricopeptide (TPR) repeat protein